MIEWNACINRSVWDTLITSHRVRVRVRVRDRIRL